MNNRIRNILKDLENVQENLLALSDDIWLNIDHNDQDALERGCQFKKEYNEKRQNFDSLACELSVLVQQFTQIDLLAEEQSGFEDENANERIVQELNREQPHRIDENFTYMQPYGFILNGKAAKDFTSWRRLYINLCTQLARLNPDQFLALPENDDFISSRGNRTFSTNPDELHTSFQIDHDVYAEVNFSANSIRDKIKKLLTTFGFLEEQLQIYLQKDRNAGRECDSLV
jgi:hypothetical protein